MAAGRSRCMPGGGWRGWGDWLPASEDTVSFVPLVSESLRPPAAEPSESPEATVIIVEFLGARVEVRGASGAAVLSERQAGGDAAPRCAVHPAS